MRESESIHGHLRHATADHHRRLDRGLDYVLGERLSTRRYVDLLAALFGFYAPFEDVLSSWEDRAASLGLRFIRRADLLRSDLRVLGHPPDRVQLCTELPTFTGINQVVGAIYVVEGACLGGQVIARAVVERLGIGQTSGAAFFTGDGLHTGVRWKEVRAWLAQRDSACDARADIVAGACCTFATLSRWLAAREVLDE